MNLIYVDEVVVMTVDGFAYHYHHHHHHHPHQSPVHQQETFLFFHFPFSISLLPLLLGELGQPNHVQFRVTVNCDDGHILLFLHLPSRCPGQRQKKKASRAEKKKVKFSSNFPFVIHHIGIHGWNCQRREKNTAVAIIARLGVGG